MKSKFITIIPKDENTIVVNTGEPHEQSSWGLKYYSLKDINKLKKQIQERMKTNSSMQYPEDNSQLDWVLSLL